MKRALLELVLVAFSCTVWAGSQQIGALTNVANLRLLSRLEANRGCPFCLTGIVTLADSDRGLFVVQDNTGAIAVHPDSPAPVRPGQMIALEAQSGSPFIVNFPAYPYQRSGCDIRTNFEAPSNWGDFHLTRMSAYLRPPITGEYTFWIASDNSSELWLSADESSTNVRNIASLRAGLWVNQHEWSRYSSQRSEPVLLSAGQAYYIEAFAEQLEQAEHLAVAWAGPGIQQSVIARQYLTPYTEQQWGITNGVFREYWTNYDLGSLAAITGDRKAESAVSAHGVRVHLIQSNVWPAPKTINLGRQLASEDNFRWVEAEGKLDFVAIRAGQATLELKAGSTSTRVHVDRWSGALPRTGTNLQVKVIGVCEAASTSNGATVPGDIWANSDDNIHIYELPPANDVAVVTNTGTPSVARTALGGFFVAQGVVTFNGIVDAHTYFVVQDANAGVFISPELPAWPGAHLSTGDSVEIGGNLLPGKFAPRIRPAVVNLLGKHVLPEPTIPRTENGAGTYRDAQWTELEGVPRKANSDGTLLFRWQADSLRVFIANTSTSDLVKLIDTTVRLRGVVSLDTPDTHPLVLVPSTDFEEVVEPAAENLPLRPVASVEAAVKSRSPHRVRISGIVTYRDSDLLVVQDGSMALQVRAAGPVLAEVGDSVEVIGFPEQYSSILALTESNLRTVPPSAKVSPERVASEEELGAVGNQSLVQLRASLLSQRLTGQKRILEVQLGHRVLQAVLVGPADEVGRLAPGSLLRLMGVCLMEAVTPPAGGRAGWESSSIGSVRLLLRNASDVQLLRGPPWWNWKKTAILIGFLLILLTGSVLRVQIMRHRFEKQQAARLAFARQLLENQESERRRIAANLHDTLGQNLLAIKNQAHLAMQSSGGEPGLQRRLEDISGTVLHALEEVRQITHDLRPYQLDRLGLSQALRALVRKAAEGCSIELASHVDDIDGVFPKESEMHIYRIVQEGINNVIKHSQATEAAVVLKREPAWLTISIRDNGRGFEPHLDGADSEAGFGLSGIRERARIMNGRVQLETAVGQGLDLKVEIPLPPANTKAPTPTPHAITHEIAHR